MRNFPWALGALLVVLIAGGIGYWLGVGANVATVATPIAGTPVVYGWHFGFPFFGLFFGLFFLFVIFALVRRIAWGRRGWGGPGGPSGHAYGRGMGYGRHGYGRHGYGPGGWSADKPLPPMADEMLQRWHKQAHGEPPTEPPTNPTTTTGFDLDGPKPPTDQPA